MPLFLKSDPDRKFYSLCYLRCLANPGDGIVPVFGEHSLTEASEKGLQITFYLKTFLKSPWIGFLARAFAFFAIVTSLLGVSLSLSDFLADGFKIKKTHTENFSSSS